MKWIKVYFTKKKKSHVFDMVHLCFKEHIDRRNCTVLCGKK